MRPIGLIFICLALLIPVPMLWSLPNINDQAALFSQYLGIAALIAMAMSQIMATQMQPLENLFGGYDRIYVLHKWLGLGAILAILIHDTVDADMRGLGRGGGLSDLAETMGEVSLYGLLILVAITVAAFIPYHLWKWTHRLMGAFFIAAFFHFSFIVKPFANTDAIGLYVTAFCLAGVAAYLWTLIMPTLGWLQKTYTVSTLDGFGDAMAIGLTPSGDPVRHRAGQFAFFRFDMPGTRQFHPFTLSDAPQDDGTLRITVKADGDHTSTLLRNIKQGTKVSVKGAFGRFGHGPMTNPQIWVAAGIGITPFMALMAKHNETDAPVHLFYCVRDEATAAHVDEIKRHAADRDNFTLTMVVSSKGKRLSADMITQNVAWPLGQSKVLYCGPQTLRYTLRTELIERGLKRRNFHYEVFEIRTGIGMRRLSRHIIDRQKRG